MLSLHSQHKKVTMLHHYDLRRALYAIFLVAVLLEKESSRAQSAISVIDCSIWQSGTSVNVTLSSGEQALLEGCVAAGVNVTLQLAPGSSVELRGWAAIEVGWVAVEGLPPEEWLLQDVDITVNSSVVAAASGPAVGVSLSGSVTILNFTMCVVNGSILTTASTTAAAVAGFAVVGEASSSSSMSFFDVVLVARDSLVGAAGNLSAVLGIALLGGGNVTVRNISIDMTHTRGWVNGTTGSSLGGIVVAGGDWTVVNISQVSFSAQTSTLVAMVASAEEEGSVAVGGVALGNSSMLLLVGTVWTASQCVIEVGGSSAVALAMGVLGGVGATQAATLTIVDLTVSTVGSTIDVIAMAETGGNVSTGTGGGLGVSGLVAEAIDINNVALNMQKTSIAISGTGATVAANGVVGGAACAQCGNMTQSNTILFMIRSNLRCDFSTTTECSAMAVAGLAACSTGLVQSQDGVLAWIRDSNVRLSSAAAATAIATCGVILGLATAVGGGQWQSNVTVWVGWSTFSITAVGQGASVALIGIASITTLHQEQTALTGSIVWCDVLFNTTPGSATSYAASLMGVASVTIANSQQQQNSIGEIGWSNVSVTSGSSTGNTLVVTIMGLAAASFLSVSFLIQQQQGNATFWTGYSTIDIQGNVTNWAAASLAGIAAASGGTHLQGTVEAGVLWSTVSITLVATNYLAAAVAGIASNGAGQQQIQGTSQWIASSTVSVTATGLPGSSGSAAACAIGGAALGYAVSPQYMSNVSLWLLQSTISSVAVGSAGYNGGAGSAVGGAACGYNGGSTQMLLNMSLFINGSNVTSASSGGNASGYSVSAAASVGGAASGNGLQTLNNATVLIAWSSVTSAATIGDAVTQSFAASSVAATSSASLSSTQSLSNILVWSGWSNITSLSVSTSGTASAIAGASMGGGSLSNPAPSPTIEDVSLWIACSMLTSNSSTGTFSYVASTAAAVVVPQGVAVASGCPSLFDTAAASGCCPSQFQLPPLVVMITTPPNVTSQLEELLCVQVAGGAYCSAAYGHTHTKTLTRIKTLTFPANTSTASSSVTTSLVPQTEPSAAGTRAQATTNMATALVVSGLSGSAAGLIQGASMVLLSPCAQAGNNSQLGAQETVAPFTVPGTGRLGQLLGLFIISVGAGTVHLGAVGIATVWLLRRRSAARNSSGLEHSDPPHQHYRIDVVPQKQASLIGASAEEEGTEGGAVAAAEDPTPDTLNNAQPTDDGRNNAEKADEAVPLFEAACAKVQFPNLSLKALYYCFQGVMFESLLLIRNNDRTVTEVVVGVVGLSLGLCFMASVHWYGTLPGRRPELRSTFILYDKVFAKVPVVLRRALLPAGFWGPSNFKERYDEMYSTYVEEWTFIMPPYALWRAAILAILVVVDPGSQAACNATLAVMAAVFFACATLILGMRPHRLPHENVTEPLINVLSGLLALASGGYMSLDVSLAYEIVVYITIAATVLSVLLQIVESLQWEPQALSETKSPAATKVIAAAGGLVDLC